MSAVIAEIMRVSQDHNLSTVVTEMPDPREFSQSLRRQPVDGALVFISSAVEPDVGVLVAERLPLVRVMGAQLAPLQIDHVGPETARSATSRDSIFWSKDAPICFSSPRGRCGT